tara:strand:- start:133 stop:291 length:159 start_codon:yes stop_codon:yes gene_type:complete
MASSLFVFMFGVHDCELKLLALLCFFFLFLRANHCLSALLLASSSCLVVSSV